jgi:hypothetical protein
MSVERIEIWIAKIVLLSALGGGLSLSVVACGESDSSPRLAVDSPADPASGDPFRPAPATFVRFTVIGTPWNPVPTPTPPPPTPAQNVIIELGSVEGSPGSDVSIGVSLRSNGHIVAGTQNDIIFNSAALGFLRSCRINPEIAEYPFFELVKSGSYTSPISDDKSLSRAGSR